MITMGSGNWSANTYSTNTGSKISSGRTFGYSNTTKSQSRNTWKAHESLDPKKKAGSASPLAGQIVREARDNDEHPNSVPISVFFDETGSMGTIPRVVQEKLGGLFTLLLRKGYVEDPQLLIGAYGDAYTDSVPLQVGQFESDNRVDETLDNLFLEGYGGGNGGETATLAWYYLAHHTATDAMEKRGKKGYAFFIGDEVALDLQFEQVKHIIGVDEPIGDLSARALAEAMMEKWEVFILLIDNTSAAIQGSEKFYKGVFGDKRVLTLEEPGAVSETIALTVGAMEGTLDIDDAEDDLKEVGANSLAIRTATEAVSKIADIGGGPIAKTAPDLNLASTDSGSRL